MYQKYFVANFIARDNDPDLSMCVCNSVNINAANGYFNGAMVLFFVYVAHSLRICVRAPFRDFPAAVFPLQQFDSRM